MRRKYPRTARKRVIVMQYFEAGRDKWTPLYDDEAGSSEIIRGFFRDFGAYGTVVVAAEPNSAGCYPVQHADPGSEDYVRINEAAGDTIDYGMDTVTCWANHSLEFVNLGRRSIIENLETPWGSVSHSIFYGDGIKRVFASGGSGFCLSQDVAARLPADMRSQVVSHGSNMFMSDEHGSILCQALPEYFTHLEQQRASGVWDEAPAEKAEPDHDNAEAPALS